MPTSRLGNLTLSDIWKLLGKNALSMSNSLFYIFSSFSVRWVIERHWKFDFDFSVKPPRSKSLNLQVLMGLFACCQPIRHRLSPIKFGHSLKFHFSRLLPTFNFSTILWNLNSIIQINYSKSIWRQCVHTNRVHVSKIMRTFWKNRIRHYWENFTRVGESIWNDKLKWILVQKEMMSIC